MGYCADNRASSASVDKARKGVEVIYVPGNHDSMARQFMGMLDGKPVGSISYTMSGKLHGASMFGTQRFNSKGEFELPQGTPATSAMDVP